MALSGVSGAMLRSSCRANQLWHIFAVVCAWGMATGTCVCVNSWLHTCVCVCGVACARGSLDPRSSVFVRVCMFVRVGAMAQAQTCEDGVGGQGSTDWVRGLWRSNRCVVPALVLQTSAQGYCAPRVDYEEVRLRVANAFKEKNHELGEMIGVIQSLSKDVARATDALRSQCR